MVCGEEVAGELVEPGCDASPVFAAAEVVLDPVSAAVDASGTPRFTHGIVSAGDDGQRAVVADVPSDTVAVVGFVGGHRQCWLWSVKQRLNHLAVMHLATGEDEVQRPAFAVNAGMDLGAPTAAADADVLCLLPPFAPLAARCALTIVLSIKCRLSRDLAAKRSNIRLKMPRRDQRLNRL